MKKVLPLLVMAMLFITGCATQKTTAPSTEKSVKPIDVSV